jgi:hypothetical protein
MTEATVSYRYFLPAPELRAMITTYYVIETGGEALTEELLFPEWANIRLLLDGDWSQTFGDGRTLSFSSPAALMSGVISRTAKIRGGPGRAVGVGFLPAGWGVFTPLPARAYVDDIVPLSTFVGPLRTPSWAMCWPPPMTPPWSPPSTPGFAAWWPAPPRPTPPW